MTPREDIRRIAAEYVIGTLDAAERAAWHERMGREPEVAALVAMWERRFFPLHELSAPARPPEGLFDLILSRLPVPAVDAPEEAPHIGNDGGEAEQAPVEAAPDSPSEEPVVPTPEPLTPAEAEAPPENPVVSAPAAEDMALVPEAPAERAPETESVLTTPSVEEQPLEQEGPEPVPSLAEPEEAEVRTPESPSADDAPESSPPAVEHPAGGQGGAPDSPAFAFERPVPPAESLPEPEAKANPWRVASGLLMLALLLGGGAFAYRELHHRTPAPQPEAPKEVEAAVTPAAPPPAESQPSVPETFAVLGPQPVPAIGFAFDHKAGTVSVLKMAVPPRAGTHYHLWLVTEMDGTHHVAQFDAPGTYPSELLQDVDAAALAGALLVVTEEEDGAPPAAPTGKPVFSGMAVKR